RTPGLRRNTANVPGQGTAAPGLLLSADRQTVDPATVRIHIRAMTLPRIARGSVTACAAVALAATALGCGVISRVKQAADNITTVGELAKKLGNSDKLTFTAEYKLSDGSTATVVQQPPDAAYLGKAGRLIVTADSLYLRGTTDGKVSCQKSGNTTCPLDAAGAGLTPGAAPRFGRRGGVRPARRCADRGRGDASAVAVKLLSPGGARGRARHHARSGRPPWAHERERLVAQRVDPGAGRQRVRQQGVQALDPFRHAAGRHAFDLRDVAAGRSGACPAAQVVLVGCPVRLRQYRVVAQALGHVAHHAGGLQPAALRDMAQRL